MNIKAIKGFKDILPKDMPLWLYVEDTAREVFSLFGYSEIKTPIMEYTELFQRGIGNDTDIVEKEMYSFIDKGGDSIALRPEGTASVVRAFIEGQIGDKGLVRLFYIGPMFRRERPQSGRFRQFNQIGAEVFGITNPSIDVEVISMLYQFINATGISDFTININSIGCESCRRGFKDDLRRYLNNFHIQLCANCQRRMERNILRVLDCKNHACKGVTKDAPIISSYRCHECQRHFEIILNSLRYLNIPFVVKEDLVRGLDYYNRTAFEAVSDKLGAQDAIAGGGRYDGLVELLGGKPTPAIGFAIGTERLIELISNSGIRKECLLPYIYIIPLGEAVYDLCAKIAMGLRNRLKKIVIVGYEESSLKSQMKKAHKSGARLVLIIGEQELRDNTIIVRDMINSTQEIIPLAELDNFFLK